MAATKSNKKIMHSKTVTATKEELQERAQLVRIHEANCKIEYPTRDEANFRVAIMKKIGFQFALRELRPANIDGPALNTPPRPAAPTRSTLKIEN